VSGPCASLSRRVTGRSCYYTGRSAGNRPRASQASEKHYTFEFFFKCSYLLRSVSTRRAAATLELEVEDDSFSPSPSPALRGDTSENKVPGRTKTKTVGREDARQCQVQKVPAYLST